MACYEANVLACTVTGCLGMPQPAALQRLMPPAIPQQHSLLLLRFAYLSLTRCAKTPELVIVHERHLHVASAPTLAPLHMLTHGVCAAEAHFSKCMVAVELTPPKVNGLMLCCCSLQNAALR